MYMEEWRGKARERSARKAGRQRKKAKWRRKGSVRRRGGKRVKLVAMGRYKIVLGK